MAVIRAMELRDVSFAHSLASSEGWNHTEDDFRRLLSHGAGGCFVGSAGGEDAGVITTTRFGAEDAFIGCLLVSGSHRGAGLGSELLDHAIGRLGDAGVRTMYLESHPRAVGLYRMKGFQPIWNSLRLLGMEHHAGGSCDSDGIGGADACAGAGQHVHPFSKAHIEPILDLDRDVTGLDRGAVLEDLLTTFSHHTYVWTEDGAQDGDVIGYICARPARRGFHLGPWVAAPDAEHAAAGLFGALRFALPGEKLMVGIPAANERGVNFLKGNGFLDGLTCTRMVLGTPRVKGHTAGIYGIMSSEMG